MDARQEMMVTLERHADTLTTLTRHSASCLRAVVVVGDKHPDSTLVSGTKVWTQRLGEGCSWEEVPLPPAAGRETHGLEL